MLRIHWQLCTGLLLCSFLGCAPQQPAEAPSEERAKEAPQSRDAAPPEASGCLQHPNLGEPCTIGRGECQGAGKMVCEKGVLQCDASPNNGKQQPELCDGKDNDCNGQIDDGLSTGQECSLQNRAPPCDKGTTACVQGKLLCQPQGTGQAEVCNGKDDDCNGKIDDDCSGCREGQTQACYTGPKGTENTGLCKAGVQTCEPDGSWGACVGQVLPGSEICDGKDNDCNGQIDEQLQAPPCQNQKGACAGAVQRCEKGGWRACTEADFQSNNPRAKLGKETDCDGVDNNCDGQTDEGCLGCALGKTRPCFSGPSGSEGKGPCKAGTQTCQSDGRWSACSGAVLPSPEICDGIDNDCDGQSDEGVKRSCTTPCGGGTQTCQNGRFGACSSPTPTAEVCDGKDNDCDGKVDEIDDLKPPLCQDQLGACARALKSCRSGQWANCTGVDYARQNPKAKLGKETDCDGVDNNCNGQTDEGCGACTPGQSKSCYSGPPGTENQGVCKGATQTCQSDGTWSACVGTQVLPSTEVCDGKDNDCDGHTDEGCPPSQFGFHIRTKNLARFALRDMVADSKGNVFVGGHYRGTLDFGSHKFTFAGVSWRSLTANGGNRFTYANDNYYLVAKFDPSGKIAWIRYERGYDRNEVRKIALDAQGNLLVTGVFERTLQLGTLKLTARGSYDIFLAKLNASGNWVWAQQVGSRNDGTHGLLPGADRDIPTSITTDSTGAVYISGISDGEVYVGAQRVLATGGSFYAKWSSSGALQWVKTLQGNSNHYIHGVHALGSGELRLTGSFLGSMTFGSTVVASSKDWSQFIAKADSSGTWSWATAGGGSKPQIYSRSQVDASGNTYVFGDYDGTAKFGQVSLYSANTGQFLAKVDDKGKWLWAQSVSGADWQSMGFAVSPSGVIALSGTISKDKTFGSTTLKSTFRECFVATMDTQGKWMGAADARPGRYFELYSLAMDSQNRPLLGAYLESISEPFAFGSLALPAHVQRLSGIAFLARLGTQHKWEWATLVESSRQGTYSFQPNPAMLSDFIPRTHTDAQGNHYIRGPYCNFRMGNNVPDVLGGRDWATCSFVMKLDPKGKWLWTAKTPQGFQLQKSFTDGKGNSYLQGYIGFEKSLSNGGATSRTVAFGSQSVTVTRTSQLSRNIVVAKLDAQGTWSWARDIDTFKPKPWEYIADLLHVDGKGQMYFAIRGASGQVTLGAKTFQMPAGTSHILCALDSAGKVLSAGAFQLGSGGATRAEISSVRADSKGDVYVAGLLYASLGLPGKTLVNHGNFDYVFMAKLDQQLKVTRWSRTWYRRQKSASSDRPSILLPDAQGNLYAAIPFQNFNTPQVRSQSVYLTKVSSAGSELWSTWILAPVRNLQEIVDVQFNGKGDLVFLGNTAQALTLGTLSLKPVGGYTYVATMSPQGTWLTATMSTNPFRERAYSFHQGAKGELFVLGEFVEQLKMKGLDFVRQTLENDKYLIQFLP